MQRISRQVLSLQSVESGQERSVTPGQHEAEMVMADIDGSQVPVLVVEEVRDVNGVKNNQYQHRIRDASMFLDLIGSPGNVAVAR